MSTFAKPLIWGVAGGALALALYIGLDKLAAPEHTQYVTPAPQPVTPVQKPQTAKAPSPARSKALEPPAQQTQRPRLSAELPSKNGAAVESAPTTGLPGQEVTAPSTEETDKQAKMHDIQTRINSMMKQDPRQIDIKQLDGVLADLQTLQGGGDYIGGVNITRVRQNLSATQEILQLSKEIEAAANRGASEAEMNDYLAQLQTLQGQLNPSVQAPVGVTQ